MTVERELLRKQLVVDEGLRLKPYRDTADKLTIGVGRNLDDVGISESEAYFLLDNDINRAVGDLVRRYADWYPQLDAVRQAALANMCFNLGIGRFGGFVRTIASVKRGDYQQASEQMLASKWASQVGARATRLSRQIRTGQWP